MLPFIIIGIILGILLLVILFFVLRGVFDIIMGIVYLFIGARAPKDEVHQESLPSRGKR